MTGAQRNIFHFFSHSFQWRLLHILVCIENKYYVGGLGNASIKIMHNENGGGGVRQVIQPHRRKQKKCENLYEVSSV